MNRPLSKSPAFFGIYWEFAVDQAIIEIQALPKVTPEVKEKVCKWLVAHGAKNHGAVDTFRLGLFLGRLIAAGENEPQIERIINLVTSF